MVIVAFAYPTPHWVGTCRLRKFQAAGLLKKELRPTFVSRQLVVNTLGFIRREGRGGGKNMIDFQLFYVKPFSEPITQIYLILIHV